MIRLSHVLAVTGVGGFLAALFWPVFVHSEYHAPKASMCLSDVKQQSLGLIVYAADADDRLPPRDAWMDATDPYVKAEGVRHCPLVPKGAYGYAFNAALSRAKTPKDAAGTPLVYESANPIRNASDPFASLPSPGRHRGSTGGRNMVSYADGHAKGIVSP